MKTQEESLMLQSQKQRILWLDVLKFIGILEIYIGHYAYSAGYLFLFVFTHHVALFFFAMGCVEYYNKDNIFLTIYKKFKSIIIPFILFSALTLFFGVLFGDIKVNMLISYVKMIKAGVVRNTFIAATLWFLTAAFVMSILFQIIKLVKFKWIMLIIALTIQYFSSGIFSIKIFTYLNIRWSFYYFIYFVIGYCSIEYIQKIFNSKNKYVVICHYILFFITTVLTMCIFFEKNPLIIFHKIKFLKNFAEPIISLIPIMFFVFLSFELKNVKIFNDLGKDTLFHCGNEYIIKTFISQLLLMFGLNLNIFSPITAIIISFTSLVLVSKLLVPWQKKILDYIYKIEQKVVTKRRAQNENCNI